MDRRQIQRLQSLFRRIEDAIMLIDSQLDRITSADYFMSSIDGQFALSGVCMQLSLIGETVKVIDHHAEGFLLSYPSIPWKQIKGLRDTVVHEYHNIDHEEVYQIITTDLHELKIVVKRVIEDLHVLELTCEG